MKLVTQLNYPGAKGRAIKGKSLTQLAEYEPLQKQLANLTIAGLNASARQALEFYDSNDPSAVDIPLLPRHITPDITEVHQVTRMFVERKQEIEARVREAHAKEVLRQKELAAAQAAASRVQGPSGPAAARAAESP